MAEFDQIFAIDPNNPQNVAENGVVSIYAPGSRNLLSLRTVTGGPLSNPLRVNSRGFGPAFMVDGYTEVAWEAVAPGEVFSGTFKSYKGVLEEAVAAKVAAQGALVSIQGYSSDFAAEVKRQVAEEIAAAGGVGQGGGPVSYENVPAGSTFTWPKKNGQFIPRPTNRVDVVFRWAAAVEPPVGGAYALDNVDRWENTNP